MSTDFTFKNKNIADFFDGKSDSPPVAEFMYIHTHFIQNNFLSEIEVMINSTTTVLKQSRSKSNTFSAEKIKNLTEQFARKLSAVNDSTASEILFTLREIYKTCKTVKQST